MATSIISEEIVSPPVVSNLGEIKLSCLIKDDSDNVLSAAVTATAIIRRSDHTEITSSPVSLSASGGKYTGTLQLTGQAGCGMCYVVFKSVYSGTTQFSTRPVYFEIKGNANSMGL